MGSSGTPPVERRLETASHNFSSRGHLCFRFLGTRGVHDRHPEDLLAFASFLVACSVIGLGCLLVDAVYVSYCDKAPRPLGKEVFRVAVKLREIDVGVS